MNFGLIGITSKWDKIKMRSYGKILEQMELYPSKKIKYLPSGTTYEAHNEDMDILFWYYETDDYIINVHDFFLKNDTVFDTFPDMSDIMVFCSTYLISANGESFNPYISLTSNTVAIFTGDTGHTKILLHGNYPYKTVGISYKEKMLNEFRESLDNSYSIDLDQMFLTTQESLVTPLGKLSMDILNVKLDPPASKLFFDAKAREWLSFTLDAYTKLNTAKQLSPDDDAAIENVAMYLSDHYAIDVPQEILERISMMSGTKLKKLFKEKYHMSITEFSQRRRMNMAESLLLTTNLEIGAVAMAVGYSSHSKFSTYYKKYKGIYPRDVRKLSKSGSSARISVESSSICKSTRDTNNTRFHDDSCHAKFKGNSDNLNGKDKK